MNGKIALEEHFVTEALEDCITGVGWEPQEWRGVLDRLGDVDERLRQMDELGIEIMVLSLGSDGAQGLADPSEARATAREANDALAEIVAAHPDRFAGFAAIAMQDPDGAAEEAERGVRELGFKGVLVNGYSDMPDGGGAYYDAPEYIPFWERFAALDVPFYLHPRNPLPANAGIYTGREELLGPTWAFAVETGTHALRLITSGLFDRLPDLQIILGHLGELLPFAIGRLEQRIAHNPNAEARPLAAPGAARELPHHDQRQLPHPFAARRTLGARRRPGDVLGRLPVRADVRRSRVVRRPGDQRGQPVEDRTKQCRDAAEAVSAQ